MHPGIILLNVLKIVSYPCKIAGSMMSMHVCQVFEMWEAIKIQKYYFWRRGDGLLTFLIFHKIIEIKGFFISSSDDKLCNLSKSCRFPLLFNELIVDPLGK